MSGLSSVMVPSMKTRQKRVCQEKKNTMRGNEVYADPNNIGARMLAQQGWSVGKGLGKREDGIAVPVAVRYKKDNEGLGFAGMRDDQWTQHDADFNELLKQLNGESDKTDDGENQVDHMAQLQSLENHSKKSRSRVHYKKFTRGKDLTQANEKDLANIFGKRSLAELNQPVAAEQNDASSENDSEPEKEQTSVMGLTTTTSSVSIHDYFKEKMKQRKCLPSPGWTVHVPRNEDTEQAEVEVNSGDETKRKKKRSKKSLDSEENVDEGIASDVEVLPKLHKRKREQVEADDGAEVTETTPEVESSEPVKKKKKSKKSKSNPVENETTAVELPQDAGEQESEPVKKKKSKKNKSAESDGSTAVVEQTVVPVVEDSNEPNETNEPVKKKKKSKRNKEPVDEVEPASTLAVAATTEQEPDGKDIADVQAPLAQDTTTPSDREEKEEDVTCRVKVEVLKHLDETGFPGSNFGNIVGYRLTEDVKLIKKESMNRTMANHRFQMKKTTVSVHRKWQKLKKVSAFNSI